MRKLLSSMFFIVLPTLAHEGHDLEKGNYPPQHAGKVYLGRQLNVEVVFQNGVFQAFPLDHENKDIKDSTLKMQIRYQSGGKKWKSGKVVPSGPAYVLILPKEDKDVTIFEVKTDLGGKNDKFEVDTTKPAETPKK